MASAAILSGGDARRFGGCDKGGLIVGGRSICDRQLTMLAAVMTAELIGGLLELALDVDVVVPRTKSGYHPLCAVVRRTCFPIASEQLDADRLAMKDLLPWLRVRVVSESELAGLGQPRWLLANVNTPAQHDELEAFLIHEL